MGRPKGWGSDMTGRPVMRSPGRPPVGRRSIGGGSGRRLLGARRAWMPLRRRGCQAWWVSDGFGRVAACHRSLRPRYRGGTCRLVSARRSRCCARRAAVSARSPASSVVHRRRSAVSCVATRRRVGVVWTIAPRRRSGMLSCAPGVPSRRSWRSTWRCGGMCRIASPGRSSGQTGAWWPVRRSGGSVVVMGNARTGGGARRGVLSRPLPGCAWSSPMMSRCGSLTRRSISRSTFKDAARCGAS